MRTVKVETVPARTTETEVRACDGCGKVLEDTGFTYTEVSVRVEKSQRCREASTFGYEFDVCERCFKEHVVTAMIEAGFKQYELHE